MRIGGKTDQGVPEERRSYIPADRIGTGLVTGMNLRENIALRKYWRKEFTRFRLFIHWENIAGRDRSAVERYSVVNPGLGFPARMLSGGNLQKLMLARELSDDPRVVIAVQPTWGLDVSATLFVGRRSGYRGQWGRGCCLSPMTWRRYSPERQDRGDPQRKADGHCGGSRQRDRGADGAHDGRYLPGGVLPSFR